MNFQDRTAWGAVFFIVASCALITENTGAFLFGALGFIWTAAKLLED